MTDFATEWQKVKRGEPSRLFASDLLYGVHISPRHSRKVLPTKHHIPTSSQHAFTQRQVPYIPWKEYAGVSSHRTPGLSPVLMEAQSKHAHAVFTHADYVLSKMRERW